MDRPDLKGEDVILGVCAKEECVAGKKVDFYAKEDRHYYALHYIAYGNGVLTTEGGEQVLKAGDFFVIPPKKDISYRAVDRWEYFWLNVEGRQVQAILKSIGLSDDYCKISYKRDVNIISRFNELIDCYYSEGDVELKGKGLFYLLMSDVYNAVHNKVEHREKRNADFYIKEALTFLEYNFYYSGVTLDSLAKSLSVNKNYLCSIFKKQIGVSPMQYLIKLRMEAAAQRLTETEEAVTSVAKYVGYKDPLHFSKAFKAYSGQSPTQYRDARHPAV